jgi:branched-subunit amino acid transport protein
MLIDYYIIIYSMINLTDYTNIIYGFILSAIIMLTVLAWKDLLDDYILKYFPDNKNVQLKWKWIYAGIMTTAFAIMTRYFNVQPIS